MITLIKKFIDHLAFELAGYSAYATLLAFFPFLIFLVALASFLGDEQSAHHFIQFLFSHLPPEIVKTLAPVVRETAELEPTGLLTIAAIGTLWAASSGVEAFRTGLNNVFEVRETRSLWWRRLQSLFMIVLAAVVVMSLSFVLIVLPILLSYLPLQEYVSWNQLIELRIVRLSFSVSLLTIALVGFYRWLPNYTLAWIPALVGGCVGSILWTGLARLFSTVLQLVGRFDIIYGSLGGIVVTLFFFHLSLIIALFGAEVSAQMVRKK